MSAVKLNLTSSVLDDESPRETHSEDSNEPLGRQCYSLSGLTQFGDASDKMLFSTRHRIWCGGCAVCDLPESDACRTEESSPDSLSSVPSIPSGLQGPESLPTLCAFHSPQDC